MKIDIFKKTNFFLSCTYTGTVKGVQVEFFIYMTPPDYCIFPFTYRNVVEQEVSITECDEKILDDNVYVKVLEVHYETNGVEMKYLASTEGVTLFPYKTLGYLIGEFESKGFKLEGGLGNPKVKLLLAKNIGMPYMYSISSFDGKMEKIDFK